MILLDTSQYGSQPRFLIGHAGSNASIQEDQWSMVDSWLASAKKVGGDRVFAGHHPLKSFDRRSRAAFLKRACAQRIPLYVSAHTHKGFWSAWRCPKSKRLLVELNVGSLLDSPVHYRDLSLFERPGDAVEIVSRRHQITAGTNEAICPKEWLPSPADARAPGNQKLKLVWLGLVKQGRRALLHGLKAELLEFEALIKRFPTADGRAILGLTDKKALEEISVQLKALEAAGYKDSNARFEPENLLERLELFESARVVNDQNQRRHYKRCLATWAAAEDAPRTSGTRDRRADGRMSSPDIQQVELKLN
jgi:hypothetical protein